MPKFICSCLTVYLLLIQLHYGVNFVRHKIYSPPKSVNTEKANPNDTAQLSQWKAFYKELHLNISDSFNRLHSAAKSYKTNRKAEIIHDALAQIRQTAQTAFMTYDGSVELVEVGIGTPAQKFLVQLEQFTSDLWVVDSRCNTDSCTKSRCTDGSGKNDCPRKLFKTKKSSTLSPTDEFSNGVYYFAEVLKDDVQIVGDDLSIEAQAFELAQKVRWDFQYQQGDGQLGFGGPPLTHVETHPTIIENLITQFNASVLTFWRDSNVSSTPGTLTAVGEMTYDSQPDVRHCAPIDSWNFADVSKESLLGAFFLFRMGGFSVGDSLGNHRQREAFVFHGFPYIFGPKINVESIAKEVGAVFDEDLYAYTIDCDGAQPDVVIHLVDGGELRFHQQQYALKVDWWDKCIFAFLPSGGITYAWGFGADYVLSNYCIAYDYNGHRISFAPKIT